MNFVAEIVIALNPQKVLEVGCNDGYGLLKMVNRSPETKFYGIDIMHFLIQRGMKKNYPKNISLSVMDACNMNGFTDRMFDAAISHHMIEHIDTADQIRFLNEVWRVLRPGGQLFISTPNRDALVLMGTEGLQFDHMHELNLHNLLWLLEECGFKVKKIYGQGIVEETNLFRPILNKLKKMDKYNFRHFIRGTVDTVDILTNPTNLKDEIKEIERDTISSNMLVVAEKPVV